MDVQVPIGKLKVHCYQILEQAQKSNNKLIITKRGHPIAEITPTHTKIKKPFMGAMQDKAKINDDLLKPLEVRWDAEK